MPQNLSKITSVILNILKRIICAPKKLATAIKNSYFRTLKGEENIAIVVFGWGVLLYVLSFFVGAASVFAINAGGMFFMLKIKSLIFPFIWGAISSLGAIFAFIYPFIFSFCLIKNSLKRDVEHIIFAATFLFLFLFIHSKAYKIVIGVSFGMFRSFTESKVFSVKALFFSGMTFIALLFFYITFKTIKSLLTKK